MPFIPTIPPGNDDLAETWAEYGAFVDLISQRLADQPADDHLAIAAIDGQPIGRVALGDVWTKLTNITWRLATADPGNGGVGAVTSFYKPPTRRKPSAWSRGDAAFMTTGFRGYAALPDNRGLFYLALHETAHVTRLGLLMQDACWRKHLKTGGEPGDYPNSPLMIYNEQVANEIVHVLAARIDIDVLPNPTHGSPPTSIKLGIAT